MCDGLIKKNLLERTKLDDVKRILEIHYSLKEAISSISLLRGKYLFSKMKMRQLMRRTVHL